VSIQRAAERVDFVGNYRRWFVVSLAVILVGLGAIAMGRLDFGIDFQGGAKFTATDVEGAASPDEVRSALPGYVQEEAIVQSVGDGGYEVSTPPLEQAESTEVREALAEGLGAEVSATTVSATFGDQARDQALQAVAAALLIIVLFISIRFEFAFAMAAIVAVFHDIVITTGVYALVGREVNLVTVVAVLTVLGYSLYDTVIIFDRIRENTPEVGYNRERFDAMINRSITQVVRRSIYTSLSTLIPITALLIFGESTLADFAFALLVGILAGTYSSIFIASPVLSIFKAWREARRPEPAEEPERTPEAGQV
jgi:preprotein translocase SecF subunit